MNPTKRLPLTIEHALLGFLRVAPRHGYEIHRRLSDPTGTGQVWRLKQSQLYALLAKLEDEGYIASTLQAQDARPTRRVFRLTKAGRETFLAWAQSPVTHGRELRLDFLVKFYFAQREGARVATTLIAAQRAACQEWLAAQRARSKALRRDRSYAWLVTQFRVGQINAMLAWLDTCEQTLE